MIAFFGVEETLGEIGINAAAACKEFVVKIKECIAAITLSVIATTWL